jgi:hypothetical protein
MMERDYLMGLSKDELIDIIIFMKDDTWIQLNPDDMKRFKEWLKEVRRE